MPCYAAMPRQPRTIHFSTRFPAQDFAPLFRLFDESPVSRPIRSFQPRFDVREEQDSFRLNGELPGIEQKDINIEFVDQNTLLISGRSVRESTSGSPPSSTKAVEEAAASSSAQAQLEESEKQKHDNDDDAASTHSDSSNYRRPSVEDEEYVDIASKSDEAAATPASSTTEVAAAATNEKQQTPEEQPKQQQQKQPKAKYWVSERSVGEFRRTFTFPGHINQDAVSASLKNGILSVVVPKALQKEPRRIVVE